MPGIEKRSVSLPQEHAAYIDRLVASGSFASASEVVRAGLRALQERDRAVERWLRDEVAPAHDAMKTDPGRGLPLDAVFDGLRARHAAAKRAGPRRSGSASSRPRSGMISSRSTTGSQPLRIP